MPKEIIIEKELLEQLYYGNGYTLEQMQKVLNIGECTLYRKMDKYGIERFWRDEFEISDEELRKLYYEDNLTILEIAKKIGCSKTGVRWKFSRAGIKTRDNSECRKGRPMSEYHKKAVSETRKRLYKEGKLDTWNKGKTNLDDKRILVGENASNFNGEIIFPVCPICGELFEIAYGHYTCSLKKGWIMHCSKACSAIDSFGPQYGDNNPNWKGGYFPYYSYYFKRIRDKILNRANNKSELTGNDADIIDVHHIYPFRMFMEEYIDLCLSPYIPYIKNKSFKIIPYDIVPDLIFEEANRSNNLIALTRQEHGEIEKMGGSIRLMLKDLVHNKLEKN